MDAIRVLVCAPDLFARVGLAALVTSPPTTTVVGQVAPLEMSLESLTIYQPDVILWDLGWEPQTQLAHLTDVTAAGYGIVGLLPTAEGARAVQQTGVSGILLRTSDRSVLVAALQAIVAGLTVFDADVTAQLFTTTGDPNHFYNSEPLTPREQEVLQSMAQGLSNKLIARHLNISEHTVKFHVNAILGKLGAQSRTEAVVRATRSGLILL